VEFKNKVVVVTGGANGIGRSLCVEFANAGAKVAVVDLEAKSASDVAELVDGIGVKADVGIEKDIQTMVDEVESSLGPVDIFVSNAYLTPVFPLGMGLIGWRRQHLMKLGKPVGRLMLWLTFMLLEQWCQA